MVQPYRVWCEISVALFGECMNRKCIFTSVSYEHVIIILSLSQLNVCD
jgi:hypothetical protein